MLAQKLFLVLQAHPHLERMLDDSEDVCGSGHYAPDVDDPEHCNALVTTILPELRALLKIHRKPESAIRAFALHLSKRQPVTGTAVLPMHLAQRYVAVFYREVIDKIKSD